MGADLEERFRPPAVFEPAIQDVCDRLLPVIREAARTCGYAIGVHGSMVRDLDLIAAPWTDDATSAEELATTIRDALRAYLGDDGVYRQSQTSWSERPHGRRSLNIVFQERHIVQTPNGAFPFIDLSIMPIIHAG